MITGSHQCTEIPKTCTTQACKYNTTIGKHGAQQVKMLQMKTGISRGQRSDSSTESVRELQKNCNHVNQE